MPHKQCFLHQPTKIFFVLSFLFLAALSSTAQFIVTGTVYDSTRVIPVKDVLVQASNGNRVITDTLGVYAIAVTDNDSLTFIYNNKPTAKFAVSQVPDIGQFNISLHVRVQEKFQTMKEVKVYSKNYRQDSIENRLYYNKLFNYDRPGVATSINPGSGTVGMDLDEFINIFRFRRNKQLKKMQDRLLDQEEENYIKYRFNKLTVKRITRLEGADLDNFMRMYRPTFEFTQMANTVEFYQYILNASYMFKRDHLIKSNDQP